MQCSATSKQTGARCKRWVTPGRTVCYYHGGAQPVGLARVQTTHGRYSKHLPTRMAARYAEAQADPDLLELRADIALLDARLTDVLGRVDSGESGRLWRTLRAINADLDTARRTGDKDGMAESLTALQQTIRQGTADWASWEDVRTLIEQRRRLVESERKRLVEMQQTLTVERAMLLVGAVAGIVKAHVSDRTTLARIAADLGALLDRPDGRGLDVGGDV